MARSDLRDGHRWRCRNSPQAHFRYRRRDPPLRALAVHCVDSFVALGLGSGTGGGYTHKRPQRRTSASAADILVGAGGKWATYFLPRPGKLKTNRGYFTGILSWRRGRSFPGASGYRHGVYQGAGLLPPHAAAAGRRTAAHTATSPQYRTSILHHRWRRGPFHGDVAQVSTGTESGGRQVRPGSQPRSNRVRPRAFALERSRHRTQVLEMLPVHKAWDTCMGWSPTA